MGTIREKMKEADLELRGFALTTQARRRSTCAAR